MTQLIPALLPIAVCGLMLLVAMLLMRRDRRRERETQASKTASSRPSWPINGTRTGSRRAEHDSRPDQR